MPSQTQTTDPNPNIKYADCSGCGGNFMLRPSGQSFQGRHKDNGDLCMGRPKTEEAKPPAGQRPKPQSETETGNCNACERKGIGMRGGKLSIHKDFVTNVRCVGSLKVPSEIPANAKQPAPRKATPKKEKAPKPQILTSPLAKAQAKAASFALSIKDHDWATTFEVNEQDIHPLSGEAIASVTAVAKRGTRGDMETMRITWWGAACIGGDNRITWDYNGRVIAVRNAAACKARAEQSHEALVKETMRVATRKSGTPSDRTKAGKLKAPSLPFDPATVTDQELIDRLIGRAVTWTNSISGKQESAQLKPKAKVTVKALKSKPGEKTITVHTHQGTKSFHLSKLVAVG